MLAPVRSRADVVRWTVVQTLLAFLLVFPTTVLTTFVMFGGDLHRSIAGSAAMRFSLLSSLVEVLAFAPVIAISSAEALRRLGRSRDAFARLAYVDPLTGLLNRRGFDAAANVAMRRAESRGAPVAALMCDLDRFKSVNDTYGHAFGDAALRHVAAVLKRQVEGAPVVLGRQGGEEFAALLTGATWLQAVVFAENLRRAVAAEPVEFEGVSARITMSFGLSTGQADSASLAGLLAKADEALYEAKERGRDRVAASSAPPLREAA